MTRLKLSFLVVSVFSSFAVGAPNSRNLGKLFTPNQVLVKFKANATLSLQANSIIRNDHVMLRALGNTGFIHIDTGSDSVETALAKYRADSNVAEVQPNYLYQTTLVPKTDPLFPQMWGLKNTGQKIIKANGPGNPDSKANPGTVGDDMNLSAAWDLVTDCSSVVVGVLDTGINYKHEDLAANMWDGGASYPNHGYDFVGNTDDPIDLNGHGTHVAGTIGAVGDNGFGSTGICWKVKLMAVRVLNEAGTGNTSDIIKGVNFAVQHGAKVLNMSFGGSLADPAFLAALKDAAASGVLVVVAAGNNGLNNDNAGNDFFPCNYKTPSMICVAALDQNFGLANFSNFGPSNVMVAAPGTNIVSTWTGVTSTKRLDMTQGWTLNTVAGSPWGYTNYTIGASSYPILGMPANYDRSANHYANSTDARIYLNLDLSGHDSASISFFTIFDTETAKDALKDFVDVNYKSTGGDPFVSGTSMGYIDGSSGNGAYINVNLSLFDCLTNTCSFGFDFKSDSANTDFGIAIIQASVNSVDLNPSYYNVIEGTSMASPHVAGLAALILAYNPNDTYADVMAAIANGGTSLDSLSGKVASGKAVNALGSLTYINAPTGGKAEKQ